jgi:hypothetical protein
MTTEAVESTLDRAAACWHHAQRSADLTTNQRFRDEHDHDGALDVCAGIGLVPALRNRDPWLRV